MPVLSKCPLCRAVMTEQRGEARCPRCGELVLPAVRKLCAGCGGDITHAKRVRDDAGEYYCHDCWADKLAARGEEPGYFCSTCRGLFPTDQVYQDGDDIICAGCLQHRNMDPNVLLDVAAHAGDERPAVFSPAAAPSPSGPPWALISVAVAVLATLVAVIVYVALQ